ncbi:hypothetical protein [Photobacterium sp. 1_MG-2023]|uniref:hypothetical protein n=1 Tax=Photobacterium sp. 1_MG-2023 TaxID=3062646 RepID=UPI0026E135ED|nr:hypothetical protein [Photobacterium sp. 1_MG-2023]MDO6705368.1 hypothetical protein [Photobacterium sp. 1_MG-2023]
MTIFLLVLGGLVQVAATYVAFFTQFSGHLYLATILMVIALASLMAIRSLIAPVCLLAGIIIGLAISHNQADLKFLNQVNHMMKLVNHTELQFIPSASAVQEPVSE